MVTVTPETVWELARRPEGSRAVQEALEQARDDDERLQLAMQFKGHICEAARCSHANYVLQKCVASLRSQDAQFIVDELTCRKEVCKLARHSFGCRLLQRLLEYCRADQVQHLGDALLSDAVGLCRHIYGNYVMQHLLIYGSDAHRSKFVSLLARHVHSVTADMTSLVVLNTAFENCNGEQCLTLAWEICKSPRGLLVASAQKRRGHQLVKLVLETLTPGSAELMNARAQLLSAEATLSATRYGRSVLRCCLQVTSEVNDDDGSPSSSRH